MAAQYAIGISVERESTTHMNAINLDTITDHGTLINTKGSECPIPILKLKAALKKAPEHSLFSVVTTDTFAERNMRDFCKSTGNEYLGFKHFDDHDVHYVKKRVIECQRCSNMRAITLGFAVVGTLAYTAPQVLNSNPSAIVTVLFAAALASLPPVLINNLRLLKKTTRKAHTQPEAAE